jgi:glycosyltransferase involved in cell wall biosynthesis/serine acetyltransferase
MFNPVSYYRLARWLHLRGIPLLPRIIEKLSFLVFHCYIPYQAEIGEGFEVGYWGVGVVIHPRVKMGRNVFVSNGVTIGGRNELWDVPRIEDDVFIATGAKVLGDVTVGHGSIIGANAVVIRSVPPRCIAVGVPARISRENVDVRDYTGWPKSLPTHSVQSTTSNSATPSKPTARIFHMVNSLEMGGSEHQMVEVASRQSARGYHVIVGCLSSKGPLIEVLKHAGVSVIEFNPKGGLYRPRGIFQLIRLTWFFVTHRFDVVQSHDLYSTLLVVPAAWLARVPVILSCRRDLSHWWWYTQRRRKFLRYIQNRSTYVIANSQAVRDFLVKQDGFSPDLIRVIRNGVDLERFTNVHRDRQKLFPHLALGSKLIAVVANMNVETKGHTDLIRAASVISRECPAAKFLLIGDGAERARLEVMTGELGLHETVLFAGRRTDVPTVLACCDLFVLPSWAEGLPNSVLEAMAVGLPVVATSVGGTPEIIEDGVNGLLVEPRDSHALAGAILQLLGNEGFAKQLARSAQERVHGQFSFDRLLSELDSLYLEARPNENSEIRYARRRTIG